MRRREFIGGMVSCTAWPLAARAQQPTMPAVGYLIPTWPGANAHLVTILRQTVAEAGYVEGRNLTIEYRFAEGQYHRLSGLAAELVQRPVAVIMAITTPAALAAKDVTATIPIVFIAPDDPVRVGLVASLAMVSVMSRLLTIACANHSVAPPDWIGLADFRLRLGFASTPEAP